MKKFKNKIFYLYSALLYTILATVTFLLSILFLTPETGSFFRARASFFNQTNDSIIVIVDQETLEHYKVWNRALVTELLDYFDTYAQTKFVALDYLVAGINKEKPADKKFLEKISKMDKLIVGFIPSETAPMLDEIPIMKEFEEKAALKVIDNTTGVNTRYKSLSKVEKDYMHAAKNFASVFIQGDKTSAKNFYASNVIKIEDKFYPSLPLKSYLVANDTNEIILNNNSIIIPKTNRKIPSINNLDGNFQTGIYYYQRGRNTGAFTHNNIPAYKIINLYRKLKNGEALTNEEKVINQIFDKNTPVFIGEYIDGQTTQATDILLTPISNRHPGVDVQASIYSNIENGDFIYEPIFWGYVIPVIIFVILTFLCIYKYNFIRSLVLIILLDLLFFATCMISAWCGYLIDFITPIVVQLVTLIFGYSFKFITENRNKEKIKQAMGKYLSQDIMKNVVNNIDDLKLGGKRAIVTVLFSDIRGFTSLSEKMTAEEVSVILNEYFAEMEPIITKYNGVINKFIGDAVMAIFGEPIQDINHPQNAVKCAYEMLKKVEYLREKWIFEGKPKIEIGVGINTGEVFIGNIGTETRMEYTVIGDTVNLASRIESYNKVYKTNLLVSSSTYSHIADIADVIKISEVQIRGKAKKMNIYEVLRIDKNR